MLQDQVPFLDPIAQLYWNGTKKTRKVSLWLCVCQLHWALEGSHGQPKEWDTPIRSEGLASCLAKQTKQIETVFNCSSYSKASMMTPTVAVKCLAVLVFRWSLHFLAPKAPSLPGRIFLSEKDHPHLADTSHSATCKCNRENIKLQNKLKSVWSSTTDCTPPLLCAGSP